MEFSAKVLNIVKQSSQCLVVGIYQGKKPKMSLSASQLDQASEKQLSRIMARGDMSGAEGSSLMIYDPLNIQARRILLVGLGSDKKTSSGDMRKAATTAAKTLNACNITSADFLLLDAIVDQEQLIRQARNIVEAVDESVYLYQETKSGKKEKPSLSKVN